MERCRTLADDNLAQEIKAALQAEAAEVEVSAAAEAALLAELAQRRAAKSPAAKMPLSRHWPVRRFLLSFCLIFCLSCVGVFAAQTSSGRGWVSGGPNYEVNSFDKMPGLVERLSFEPRYPQAFANGYSFTDAHVSGVQGLDEQGRRMSHIYLELYVNYYNLADGEDLVLNVDNIPNGFGGRVLQTRQVGNVELQYEEQPYKFVPVDYVLTDADWAALADGSLEISVGSDAVEENLLKSVVWVQDGVKYHLFGFDLSLSSEELLDMAAEIAALEP